MKTKSIFVSLLLLCTGGISFADYIWNGGSEITPDKWATQSNWELTNGSSWNATGTGPSSTGSNMWDHVSVSNSNGTISNLEGWALKLTLVNSNLTVGDIKKFQGDPKYINIDKTSTLTVNSFAGGNDGGNMSISCFGIFNLALAKNMGGDAKNLSLGESGIMNFTSANGNSYSINNLSINFTLSVMQHFFCKLIKWQSKTTV